MKIFLKRVVSFGVDLFFAGLLLIFYLAVDPFPMPPSAERVMPLNGAETGPLFMGTLIDHLQYLVVVVFILWFLYTLINAGFFKESLGYRFVGLKFKSKPKSFLKRWTYLFLGPVPTLEKAFGYQFEQVKKHVTLRYIGASLISLFTYLAFILYLLIIIFAFTWPRVYG